MTCNLRHLQNLHKDNELVVEDHTAWGQRHELPAKASKQAMETAMEINELEINPTEEKIDHSHNIVDPEEQEADSDKEYISGPVPATPPRRTTGPRRAFAQWWTVDSALLPQAITDTPSDLEETPKKPKGRPALGRRSTARPQMDQQELAGSQEPRCDARHTSRRDVSATLTTPTSLGVISD